MKKFSINKLTNVLKTLDYIEFAYLFGSSSDGTINKNSDIDIAVYISDNHKVGFDTIAEILRVVDQVATEVKCDICRLNNASEIMAFEALKGKQLFVKENSKEQLASFYSKTCRNYEDYKYWTKKQLEYRGIKT